MSKDLFFNPNLANPVPNEISTEISHCLSKGYLLSNSIFEQTNFKSLKRSHSLPWIRRDAIDFVFEKSNSLTVNTTPVYGAVKPLIISYNNFVFSHHHNSVGKSNYRKNLIEKHNNTNSLIGNNDYFSIVHCGKFSLESINFILEFQDGKIIEFPVDIENKIESNIQEEIKDLTDQYLQKKDTSNLLKNQLG